MRALAALPCAALLATSATGCLITDSPQFQVPAHTAPFLVAATALPDVRNVVVVDSASPNFDDGYQFQANVISQDDPAGSGDAFTTVHSNLYIDYGLGEVPGLPFRYVIPGTDLAAGGTLDETTGRTVTATWYPQLDSVADGCHTATLIASHIFVDPSGCPACDNDYSTLTWLVLACDSSMMGSCDPLPTMMGECLESPHLTTCASALADAGSQCPESTDGGM
jgi:hypothetical protein